MNTSVLYVEDDPVQASLVSSILEDEGFRVTHLGNSVEALARLKVAQFDIVLTDHYMPNMTGVELIERIQQDQIDVPTVIMTAASEVSLAFSALKAGAADFISKDCDGHYFSIIAPVLHRVFEQHCVQRKADELAAHIEEIKTLSYKTLDAINQGVVTLNNQAEVVYCNGFFKNYFGLKNNELASGKNLEWLVDLIIGDSSVYTPAQIARLKMLAQQCLYDCRSRLEIEHDSTIFELQVAPLPGQGHVLSLTDITHQKDQLEAMGRVINAAPVSMLAVDIHGRIVLANRRIGELVGVPADNLLGTSVDQLVPPPVQKQHGSWVSGFFQGDEDYKQRMSEGIDVQLLNTYSQLTPVELSLSSVRLDGHACVLATIVDISHRKKAERLMQRAHELTQSIIHHSPFAIVATDLNGTIIAVSPALEKLLWYEREQLIHQHNAVMFVDTKELTSRAHALSEELAAELAPDFNVLTAKAKRGIVEGEEWTFVRRDGSALPVNLTVTTLRDSSDEVTGFLLVAYDISEQKRANEYIKHIAHHDGLTGLPNRTLMQDRLEGYLLRAQRQGTKVGVFVLDLDHFKRINDSLGHMAGDQLLKEVAKRLQMLVRASDTVCRMGGDEFVVLLPDIKHARDVKILCNKILQSLNEPVHAGINKIVVTPSIGVCLAPDDGTTTEQLLKHADIAMYHAKQTGRNGYQIFDRSLAETNIKNLALEQALHSAVYDNKLNVYYQPQVNLHTREIGGFEALLRWHDDERGQIAPQQFIPMAETTGFIVTLGEWVLNQACKDIQRLRQNHNKHYRLAVNVSPRQFESSNFIAVVKNALAVSGLPAEALELEITEGLLATHSKAMLDKLHALKRLGVLLALDDFGTGYSSLAYIARYPIHSIKIDRTFMALEDQANLAIVSAIAAMAEGLNLQVIAEGVETKSQMELISNRGCHLVQGFYFSRPVAIEQINDVIANIQSMPRNLQCAQ